jgi:hypothetical protein
LRTNYVLIDYENVQPSDMNTLDKEYYKIILFHGASQANVKIDIVTFMHRIGTRGEYVKISGNGKNALDFHIPFYIGRLSIQEPSAFFHIISKDSGFDPVVVAAIDSVAEGSLGFAEYCDTVAEYSQ